MGSSQSNIRRRIVTVRFIDPYTTNAEHKIYHVLADDKHVFENTIEKRFGIKTCMSETLVYNLWNFKPFNVDKHTVTPLSSDIILGCIVVQLHDSDD